MPLWCEVYFEIKIYKTHQVRTKTHFEVKTFGSWDVEKMHAVVARSTFRRQNVQITSWLLEVEMSKKCTPLWQETHFEVKIHKIHHVRTTCRSYDIEKAHVVVARCIFQMSKVLKTDGYRTVLDVQICFGMAGARAFTPSQKLAKTRERFCSISKNDARHGTFEDDLWRCISRGRRSTKDMFIRDVRGSGRWLPERGCTWGIRSVGLLR